MFQAAVFIGSPVPFSKRTDVGIDARSYFGVDPNPPNPFGRPTTVPAHLVTDPAYLRNPAQLDVSGDDAEATLEGVQYQMFHPSTDTVRLGIPTGHVYGSRDKWFPHSKDLAALCRGDVRTVFQHCGGHEVPRGCEEELCDLIETVFSKIRR